MSPSGCPSWYTRRKERGGFVVDIGPRTAVPVDVRTSINSAAKAKGFGVSFPDANRQGIGPAMMFRPLGRNGNGPFSREEDRVDTIMVDHKGQLQKLKLELVAV